MKGETNMTDLDLLREKVEQSGLKNSFIAEKLGISKAAWYKKLKGQNKLTTEEVQGLCEVLHITSLREKEDIFFA